MMTYEQIVQMLQENVDHTTLSSSLNGSFRNANAAAAASSPASPPEPKPHVLPKATTESVIGPLAASLFGVALVLGIANAAR